MHPRLTKKILLLALGILSSTAMKVAAQGTLPPYKVVVDNYNVTVNYDIEKARAGEEHFKIEVQILTPGPQNLKLIDCGLCTSEGFIFSKVYNLYLAEETRQDLILRTKFILEVGIKPGTEARQFDVPLRFEQPDPHLKVLSGTFPLFVASAAADESRLVVVPDPKNKDKPESCISGAPHTFALKLNNGGSSAYPVNLQMITITTSPTDLFGGIVTIGGTKLGKIDQNTIVFDPPLTFTRGQPRDLTVGVQMTGNTAANYLFGFDEDTQVAFSFKYDDGYGRTSTNYTYAKPLRVQPGWLVLAVAVILGISAGVFLMSIWHMLNVEGNVRSRLLAVFGTAVIGLIVSLLIFTGQLNISLAALKVSASYDKPLTLFLMSLIATIGGTPLLKKFVGLEPRSGGSPATPAPAGPPST